MIAWRGIESHCRNGKRVHSVARRRVLQGSHPQLRRIVAAAAVSGASAIISFRRYPVAIFARTRADAGTCLRQAAGP